MGHLGSIVNIVIIISSPDPRENIRSIILRDDTDWKENIEIRRVFVHPSFQFPNLYHDIAVAELGNNTDWDHSLHEQVGSLELNIFNNI